MKGYWIAFVTISDEQRYRDYLARAPQALQQYGARILARGEELQALEGFEALPQRAVVFEFPSYEQALACYHSPEYQAAKAYRDDVAQAQVLIIRAAD